MLIDGKSPKATFDDTLPLLYIFLIFVFPPLYLDTEILNNHISNETEQGKQVGYVLRFMYLYSAGQYCN